MTQMASPTEEPVVFACAGEHLLGVVTRPPPGNHVAPATVGAVIVVGGPQYRAGSHRQFVQWARALAAGGTPALRFDARGMGDSTGELQHFTALSPDIGAAIRALRSACPGVERVVLCGLCDGASAALLYLYEHADPQVCGLVLLNPWVRSEQSQARTVVKHYYTRRLMDRGFWSKVFRGQLAMRSLRELGGHMRQALRVNVRSEAAPEPSYQTTMAAAMNAMHGPVLLVLSGSDYTAKEFLEYCATDSAWRVNLRGPCVQRVDLANADHTFSAEDDRVQMQATTVAWFARLTCTRSTPSVGVDV